MHPVDERRKATLIETSLQSVSHRVIQLGHSNPWK